MTAPRSVHSITEIKSAMTCESGLSESLRRKPSGEAGAGGAVSTSTELNRISCFIRPKTDKDGGSRIDELINLNYDPYGRVSIWLDEMTVRLREPIRGSNSFPKSAPLSPTTFLVALYSLDTTTYPATLTRIYSFDTIMNSDIATGAQNRKCFYLKTLDQQSSGIKEFGGEWIQNEIEKLQDIEPTTEEADGDESRQKSLQQDIITFARHTCFRLSCCIEAAARDEVPLSLLTKWLVGGLDRAPILSPAYWSCLATLVRDRALSDPQHAIVPLSTFLGACMEAGVARCSATVVRDQPTSKARVQGEHSARYCSRSDPRGIGQHFLEQASFTTIDESDDTTYANPKRSRAVKSLATTSSILEDIDESTLGDTTTTTGEISGENSQSLESESVVSSISVNSVGTDSSTVGMPKVRYTEFNDRSNVDPGFFCNCLSCKPDPSLQHDDEEVYGLGAVRYWWYADWFPSTEADAYKVGNQYSERSAVRRVALGQPVHDALKGAPLPCVMRRRRRQVAHMKALRLMELNQSQGSLPSIDGSSSSIGTLSGDEEEEAEEETEVDSGLEEMKRLIAIQGALHLCSDPHCPVRRQELNRIGGIHPNIETEDEKKNKEAESRLKLSSSSKRSTKHRNHKGAVNVLEASLKVKPKVGSMAENNPLKAMQAGFGVHHFSELEEEKGLQRVSLPFHTPEVRVDLIDTIVANGVVARIWFAKGIGLSDQSGEASNSAIKSRKGKNEIIDEKKDDSSTKKGKSRGSVLNLPQLSSKSNSISGSASVASAASSLQTLQEEEEETRKNNKKKETKEVKAEDIPQQHYVDWVSLSHCRSSSQWHGPFNSDGAAHRHLHHFLDLSHVLFEVMLRKPFSTRLRLLQGLLSTSKLGNRKQRASLDFALKNKDKLKEREQTFQVLRKRLELKNKSLRWQLPILFLEPNQKKMNLGHYKLLENKLRKKNKLELIKKKKHLELEERRVILDESEQFRSEEYPITPILDGTSSQQHLFEEDENKNQKAMKHVKEEEKEEQSQKTTSYHSKEGEAKSSLFKSGKGLFSGATMMSAIFLNKLNQKQSGDDEVLEVSKELTQMFTTQKGYISTKRIGPLVKAMRSGYGSETKPSDCQQSSGTLNKTNEDDDEEDASRTMKDEALDSLIDLCVELFRNKCIRNDQILVLLESLVSPIGSSGAVNQPTTEARSVAMPNKDLIHNITTPLSVRKKKPKLLKPVEYDAESVMVACRLLLTGVGYSLDLISEQTDALAVQRDLLKSCWFEKDLQAAMEPGGSVAANKTAWHNNLSAGVSMGGHPKSLTSHGNSTFSKGDTMAHGVPVASFPTKMGEPHHVGALSRILRSLTDAAESFRLPHPQENREENGKEEEEDRMNTKNKKKNKNNGDEKDKNGFVVSSPASVYSPSKTLTSKFKKKEKLLTKMWDEEDFEEVARLENEKIELEKQEAKKLLDAARKVNERKKNREEKLKRRNSKKDKEEETKKMEEKLKNSNEENNEIPLHCDNEIANILSSASKFVHLVRKVKWDIKVAKDIDLEHDIVHNLLEEEEETISVNNEVGDELLPPHNYARGACRTPKENQKRPITLSRPTSPSSSISSLSSHAQPEPSVVPSDNISRQSSHQPSSHLKPCAFKHEVEKRTEEEEEEEWNEGRDKEDAGSWVCPVSGAYLWREERISHLLSDPIASKAYYACWEKQFENLKLKLKQTHVRRRALLIHKQAHLPFTEALCCLIDCHGDENLAFSRLAEKPLVQNNDHHHHLRDEDHQLQKQSERCGEAYRVEMRLGSSLVGDLVSKWASEKRVRKDWSDILEKKRKDALSLVAKDKMANEVDALDEAVLHAPVTVEDWW